MPELGLRTFAMVPDDRIEALLRVPHQNPPLALPTNHNSTSFHFQPITHNPIQQLS